MHSAILCTPTSPGIFQHCLDNGRLLANFVDCQVSSQPSDASDKLSTLSSVMICLLAVPMVQLPANRVCTDSAKSRKVLEFKTENFRVWKVQEKGCNSRKHGGDVVAEKCVVVLVLYSEHF